MAFYEQDKDKINLIGHVLKDNSPFMQSYRMNNRGRKMKDEKMKELDSSSCRQIKRKVQNREESRNAANLPDGANDDDDLLDLLSWL